MSYVYDLGDWWVRLDVDSSVRTNKLRGETRQAAT
jgi:hypothetical protein